MFFDRELLEYAAPFEVEPETWTLQTGFGNRTIAAIAESSSRPQLALMAMLALVMAAGVFLVAGAAAREVRLAELKSNFVASVSHDLKTPLALIQLFAETLELGPRAHARAGRGVLPHHQRRGEEADPPDREHPRLLADGGGPAALSHGAGRPRRGDARRGGAAADPVRAGPLQVVTRVEPGLPSVDIDTGAVEQAIENLLANAMKYSRENATSRSTSPAPAGTWPCA